MENYKINDCHIHIGKSSGVNSSIELKDLPSFIQSNKIGNALLMPSDLSPEWGNCMIQLLTRNLNHLYGLHWIIPNGPAYEIDENMIGYKYHGAYCGKPISHREHWLRLETVAKKEGVLMVHCGRYKEGGIESNTSYLHPLEIAKMYGGTKIIMAHMGGTDTTVCKKAIKASRDYPNIFFDTSGITTPYIIEFAVQEIGAERILFGSDAPWCSFRAMCYTVMDANISEEDKQKILGENFNALIKEKTWNYLAAAE